MLFLVLFVKNHLSFLKILAPDFDFSFIMKAKSFIVSLKMYSFLN